jgi:hypothetical protein
MCNDISYPTTKSPQKLTLLLQHGSVSNIEQRFRAGTMSTINSTPQYPLSPKTSGAPTMQQVFFSRQNTFYIQFRIPNNIKYELPHNHSKNPRHTHPLLYDGP